MPGYAAELEARVAELIAGGMNPAAAVAVVTSKKTKEQNLHLVGRMKGPAPKGRGKGLKRA